MNRSILAIFAVALALLAPFTLRAQTSADRSRTTSAAATTPWKLADGETLLATPVSYQDAWYLITESSDGKQLSRVTGSNSTDWQIDPKFDIRSKSFAFASSRGELRVITADAIGLCNLESLGDAGSIASFQLTSGTNPISVAPSERPAMGPDGSLYFRNVRAEGQIDAYDPTLQKRWSTKLKFSKVSPISLSENGRFAYLLADIPVDLPGQTKLIALVQIETDSGETQTNEIVHTDAGTPPPGFKPRLIELLQPAVQSRMSDSDNTQTDYVFASGNRTNDGIIQLMKFSPGENTVLWSRMGKEKVVRSERDGGLATTSIGDGSLGHLLLDEPDEAKLKNLGESMRGAGMLLTNGPAPVLAVYTNQDIEDRLNQIDKQMKEQDDKLNQEIEAVQAGLDEQEKTFDTKIGEVNGSLQEQAEELDEVSKNLDQQNQQLSELNDQIASLISSDDPSPAAPGTTWHTWAALALGLGSMLACLILMWRISTSIAKP